MATPPILIDTSIFIEHLRKQNKTKSILYDIVGSYALHTSTVVEFELYAGATGEQKQ
jgi:predicted nucleic acid-binding protein